MEFVYKQLADLTFVEWLLAVFMVYGMMSLMYDLAMLTGKLIDKWLD